MSLHRSGRPRLSTGSVRRFESRLLDLESKIQQWDRGPIRCEPQPLVQPLVQPLGSIARPPRATKAVDSSVLTFDPRAEPPLRIGGQRSSANQSNAQSATGCVSRPGRASNAESIPTVVTAEPNLVPCAPRLQASTIARHNAQVRQFFDGINPQPGQAATDQTANNCPRSDCNSQQQTATRIDSIAAPAAATLGAPTRSPLAQPRITSQTSNRTCTDAAAPQPARSKCRSESESDRDEKLSLQQEHFEIHSLMQSQSRVAAATYSATASNQLRSLPVSFPSSDSSSATLSSLHPRVDATLLNSNANPVILNQSERFYSQHLPDPVQTPMQTVDESPPANRAHNSPCITARAALEAEVKRNTTNASQQHGLDDRCRAPGQKNRSPRLANSFQQSQAHCSTNQHPHPNQFSPIATGNRMRQSIGSIASFRSASSNSNSESENNYNSCDVSRLDSTFGMPTQLTHVKADCSMLECTNTQLTCQTLTQRSQRKQGKRRNNIKSLHRRLEEEGQTESRSQQLLNASFDASANELSQAMSAVSIDLNRDDTHDADLKFASHRNLPPPIRLLFDSSRTSLNDDSPLWLIEFHSALSALIQSCEMELKQHDAQALKYLKSGAKQSAPVGSGLASSSHRLLISARISAFKTGRAATQQYARRSGVNAVMHELQQEKGLTPHIAREAAKMRERLFPVAMRAFSRA